MQLNNYEEIYNFNLQIVLEEFEEKNLLEN